MALLLLLWLLPQLKLCNPRNSACPRCSSAGVFLHSPAHLPLPPTASLQTACGIGEDEPKKAAGAKRKAPEPLGEDAAAALAALDVEVGAGCWTATYAHLLVHSGVCASDVVMTCGCWWAIARQPTVHPLHAVPCRARLRQAGSLASLKLDELKLWLKAHDQRVSGNKADLIARIKLKLGIV
jgi:hypothetical protein